tara:strand:+ start:3020 stop:3931 length:912 start_codon:yes stop_codon:yes gene_type:complete
VNKIIYVFCGLDLHKNTMEHCIKTLLSVRDDVDVGVATYGNSDLPPSVELSKMCQEMNIPFHDCERQTFNKMPLQRMVNAPHLPADVDCCELTGMFQISSHFYQNYDYEMVILMHPDTLTLRNHQNSMESYLGQDYCIIGPLINLDPNRPVEDENIFVDMSGADIAKTRFRISQAIFSFGKKYCLHMIEKYKTVEEIWKNVYGNYVKWGDCSSINLYPQHEGFNSFLLHGENQLLSQQSFGEHHLQNLDYHSFLSDNKKFNFVHIGHPPPGWSCPPRSPGRFKKEQYVYWLSASVSGIRKGEQ